MDESYEFPEELVAAKEKLDMIAETLGNVQCKLGLDIVPAEYKREAIKPAMMHVVREWALGRPFKDICPFTEEQEGTIVRCIMRLDETCRGCKNAARAIGDQLLRV